MKQFGKILKFELLGYFANRIFVGVTLFLVIAIAAVMFFPRVSEAIKGSEEDRPNAVESTDELPEMLITGESILVSITESFTEDFPEYSVKTTEYDIKAVKKSITSGEAECAFVFNNDGSYTYYVNNLSMYDNNTAKANEILQSIYRLNALLLSGMTAEQATEIMSLAVNHETVSLGKDQMQNFFYTYIMIFALYMVILLYGQMVATNVATEKSSRAMEVLITSAKPVSMMFGKVIASCLAGLAQLIAVFGSALLFYNMNKAYWSENMIIASIFDMPVDLLIYMLIFFVLGYFMYAFMFGAVGSTASKLEDINTSVMPITLLFVAGFLVVMMSMTSGDVDTLLMKTCSFIPFTAPMAMFTRIAMGNVNLVEIIAAIAILIVSVAGIGVLSAKIYRVGVLLYGTPPKLGAIIKAIKKA